MRLIVLVSALAVLGAVNAKAILSTFLGPVTIGESYTVEWNQDQRDVLSLHVIKQIPGGWIGVDAILEHKRYSKGDHDLTWNVSESIEEGEGYALYLMGQDYADLTGWFEVLRTKDDDGEDWDGEAVLRKQEV